MQPPPTIIVVHSKEKPSKCTVEPLRGSEGFIFLGFPVDEDKLPNLSNYVRLGIGGEELSIADAGKGLLILDATWRHAARMEEPFIDVPIRTISNWQTAYPRQSKIFDNPNKGLATIEAIYAAYTILNRPIEKLLDTYYWREQFLEINSDK